MNKPYYRSVFISDVHLGSKNTDVLKLMSFLKSIKFDNLYIIGDLLDVWRLARRWYFPKEQSHLLNYILKLSLRKKAKVVYILGNHDDVF
jgi:UDP-2,3-diacylglucosamine pyrophosphatase LpxH